MIYNPNNSPVKVSIPKGTWTIVANSGHAGVKALGHAKGKVAAPGLTVEVLYQ